jgi:hypothetical protein
MISKLKVCRDERAEVRNSFRRIAAAVAISYLIAGSPAFPSVRQAKREQLLRSIAVSPGSINPSLGEKATLHISLARPARLEVQIIDRDGYSIRTLTASRGVVGDNVATWDGRDDRGEIVPDEAWSFRVIADGGADEFFPAAKLPTMISIDPLSFSRSTATLRYRLPSPSRVHVQAGTVTTGAGSSAKGEGPVLKTVVDREPRGAGYVAEHWNGFDASGSIYVPDLPGFALAIAVTPLPEQSVITFGNAKHPFLAYASQRMGKSLLPQRSSSVHHAGLDVFHDVAPRLTLVPDSDHSGESVWTTNDRDLRFHLHTAGPTARAFEDEPGKIFVFIDGQLVETRDVKEAASAFVLHLPGDGEHRIAINWRSDYGPVAVAVARVRVASTSPKGTE